MIITIRLYGALRDLLPPAQRGRAQLTLPEGATVVDALRQVGLTDGYLTAINGEHLDHNDRLLAEGDELLVFAPSAGGKGAGD